MENIATTVTAVGKILTAVILGASVARGIPSVHTTIKDLSFVITNVMVPCFFATRMAASVTWELLQHGIGLMLFSLMGTGLGYILGKLFGWALFPHGSTIRALEELWRTKTVEDPVFSAAELRSVPEVPDHEEANHAYSSLTVLAGSFQNTVVIPLSLLLSLKDTLAWIDFDQGLAYIVVYNISVTVFFWSCGPLLMRESSLEAKRQRRIFTALRFLRTVEITNDASCDARSGLVEVGSVSARSAFCVDVVNHAFREWKDDSMSRADRTSSRMSQLGKAFANAPFIAMVVGVSIGLIPPAKAMYLNGAGRVLYDGMYILGDGTIPCALLLLGANLSSGSTPGSHPLVAHSKSKPTVSSGTQVSPDELPAPEPVKTIDEIVEEEEALPLAIGARDEERAESIASEPQSPQITAPPPPSLALKPMSPGSHPQSQDSALSPLSPLAPLRLPPATNSPTHSPAKVMDLTPFFDSSEDDVDEELEDEAIANLAGGANTHVAIVAQGDDLRDSFAIRNATRLYPATPAGVVQKDGPPVDAVRRSMAHRVATRFRPLFALFSLGHIDPKFVFGVPTVRLIFVPLFGLILIELFLRHTPAWENKTLMLVLIMETAAPTAINTALIANIYSFHVFEFAKMLLYQYTFAAITAVGWLSVGLWYIGA